MIGSKDTVTMMKLLVMTGGFDEALKYAEESLEKAGSNKDEIVNEIYYYRLLAHFKATDDFEMSYIWSIRDIKSDEYYIQAVDHMCDLLKEMINFCVEVADVKREGLIKMLDGHLRRNEYIQAIRVYKSLGEKEKAKELCQRELKRSMENDYFEDAKKYAYEMADVEDNMKLYLKMPDYSKAREEFKKEIPDTERYACDVCKRDDNENYRRYMEAKRNYDNSGYTEGKGYAISLIIALIMSALMLFDGNVNNSFIYVVWGVCISVALHIKFMWDFTVVKSIGLSFLLCVAPLIAYTICDEIFSEEFVGAIVVFAGTLIAFLLNLKRDMKYNKANGYRKEAEQIKKEHLDSIIFKERDRLYKKYAPMTDDETALRWAKEVDLPICF